jgi:hypothetical protein
VGKVEANTVEKLLPRYLTPQTFLRITITAFIHQQKVFNQVANEALFIMKK